MASTVENLIIKGCTLCFQGAPSKNNLRKFGIIASRFATLKAFCEATIPDYNNFKTVEGTPCFRPLTDKEKSAVENLKVILSPTHSVEENFIKLLTNHFIKKQLKMLDEMSIEKLNANPMLCKALNFHTPDELVRYNAYAAISRSIVTSMGFLLQNFLLFASADAYDGKDYAEGNNTKFDVVIERLNGFRAYIELKSGPNDLDAAQIKHYASEISAVEKLGYKGYIGIAYGKKDADSVSLNLLQSYLPDWYNKTLIGQELWEYVTDNPSYHHLLMDKIEETSRLLLGSDSIIVKIEERIQSLTAAFAERYPSLEAYYSSLW